MHPPHLTQEEMGFAPQAIDALASVLTTDRLILERSQIQAADAMLTGLILRSCINYHIGHDIYTISTAALLDLARQLHAEHTALTRAHQVLRRSLAELTAADYDHTYEYGEAINELLVAEEEGKPVADSEEGLIYRLHSDSDRTWFVRFAEDPETGSERITVYYRQARDAARYPVADSRDTDARICRCAPGRRDFESEVCELLADATSGADFTDDLYLLIERYGHKDLYDAAYNRVHGEESAPLPGA